MEAENITLAYWNIRGITEPIRMMLEYIRVPYVLKELPFEGETAAVDWHKFGEDLGLEFPAVPCMRDPENGLSLSYSVAICRYLAQKYKPKMVGSAMNEYAEVDALTYISSDIRKNILAAKENGWAKNKEPTLAWVREKLGFVEKFLRSKTWLSGKQPSIADFMFCEVLELINSVDPVLTSAFTRCMHLQHRLFSIPEVAKYRATQKEFGPPDKVLVPALLER